MPQKNKKNILIGGLLAIVLVMAVGYAAFATSLNITSTSSITSNWCIGFDSRNTNAYTGTTEIAGGTVPTGSISFSGDTCATNYKTTASLNASFKQPGDKVEYTLTIANKSSLAAAIESIEVDGDSVTSNTTIIKGNIKFIIEMPETTSLAVDATTTMKVTAMFQNDTDVTSSTTEQQSISVSINTVQDDGTGGFTPTSLVIDQTFVPQYYEYHIGSYVRVNNSYNTSAWTQDASTLEKDYYAGHDVDSTTGNVIANYACFILNNTQYCLKGRDSTDTIYHAQNKELLGKLKDANKITCSEFSDFFVECSSGSFGYLYSGSNGRANAGILDYIDCVADQYGNSNCYE